MPSALLVCPSTSDKPERIERTRLDSSELAANQRATPYLTDFEAQIKGFLYVLLVIPIPCNFDHVRREIR